MADIIRSSQNSIKNNSPRLFSPSVVRNAESSFAGGVVSTPVDGGLLNTTAAGSENAYMYKQQENGLISTQQLFIDWENFSSHTFFQSAQVKVNTAFDLILNNYPFDGSQKDIEMFLDGITGYERWVFDNYPKYEGYLYFQPNDNDITIGTAVSINDIAGASYPLMARTDDGKSYINPGTNSFSLEFQVFLAPFDYLNQYILEKHTGTTVADNEGFAVTVSASVDLTASVDFHVFQEGKYFKITAGVEKGIWQHVAFVWDRTIGNASLTSYVNAEVYQTASLVFEFNSILPSSSSLNIGSGSAITGYFEPEMTFLGLLDELRIWHKAITRDHIKENKQKTIFAQDGLAAYYRFDESVQDYDNQSAIVIDSSGNSLHGTLNSYGLLQGVRTISTESIGISSDMIYSRLPYLPVLFATDTNVTASYLNCISGAAEFDQKNPSLITKLVPKHYLLEGMSSDGLTTEEGDIVNPFLGTDPEPHSAQLGGTQAFLLLLYTWAKFFDEIKLFTKAFVDTSWADYDETNTVPDAFLRRYANQLGIDLPSLFQNSELNQYLYGDNIENKISINDMSLQTIQNKVWRRLLTNIPDILKSKGTTTALKQYVRSLGMEPDSIFRIREYGGPTKRSLGQSREDKVDTVMFADFFDQPTAYFWSDPPMLRVGIRTEAGYPFTDDSSSTSSTQSFFSGSWTSEGWYRLNSNTDYVSQSLIRFEFDDLSSGASFLISNIVAEDSGNLSFFWGDDAIGTSDTITMSIPANLYDGDLWHISFGRRRFDDGLDSQLKSLYFLRAAKKIGAEIVESYQTSSYYNDLQNESVFIQGLSRVYVSPGLTGAYTVIGNKEALPSAFIGGKILSNELFLPSIARTWNFDGKVAESTFFSKYIDNDEWLEHVRNFHSVGVKYPSINWNFDFVDTGSFQRLRHQWSFDQIITSSDSGGNIIAIDYSQQSSVSGQLEPKYHMSGVYFTADTEILKPQDMWYTQLSSKFDSSTTIEKIRVRGYNDQNSIENPWENFGPAYEIPKNEIPTDNTKIGIDFSVIDALDKDILTIFGTLDEFENMLGATEGQFLDDYPALETLRKNYFNKLETKINLRGIFMFYKWFDTNFATYLMDLLPYNAKFNGSNYVIESHVLERAKLKYMSDDVYHGQGNRDYLTANITTQFITGKLGRY